MTTFGTPREFLNALTADEMRVELERAEEVAQDAGLISPGTTDIHSYIHSTLKEDYPGIAEFVMEQARRFKERGADMSFIAGFLAGSILTGSAITRAAEEHELPS